jgi:hypothetical protein
MSNLVARCWIIVEVTNQSITPTPMIYLYRPVISPLNTKYKLTEHNNVFEAKKYIQSFIKHQTIRVIGAA